MQPSNIHSIDRTALYESDIISTESRASSNSRAVEDSTKVKVLLGLTGLLHFRQLWASGLGQTDLEVGCMSAGGFQNSHVH